MAIFAPAGTNALAVKKIQSAMKTDLSMPEVREKLMAQGLDLAPVAPEKLSVLLRDELVKWARIVKASGAQLD